MLNHKENERKIILHGVPTAQCPFIGRTNYLIKTLLEYVLHCITDFCFGYFRN